MLSPLYTKLIGAGIAALVVIGLFLGLRHYKSLAEDRGAKLATICQATRDASGQPKLNCGDVPEQIKFQGEAIKALSNSLKVQNAAVASLGEQTAAAQKESAKASVLAQERARGAEATSARLKASSRSGEAQAKPCEPSKVLKGSWK